MILKHVRFVTIQSNRDPGEWNWIRLWDSARMRLCAAASLPEKPEVFSFKSQSWKLAEALQLTDVFTYWCDAVRPGALPETPGAPGRREPGSFSHTQSSLQNNPKKKGESTLPQPNSGGCRPRSLDADVPAEGWRARHFPLQILARAHRRSSIIISQENLVARKRLIYFFHLCLLPTLRTASTVAHLHYSSPTVASVKKKFKTLTRQNTPCGQKKVVVRRKIRNPADPFRFFTAS